MYSVFITTASLVDLSGEIYLFFINPRNMKKFTRSLFPVIFLLGFTVSARAASGPDTIPDPTLSFFFSLPASAKTSAGVFTADSTLIRTLWSGIVYPAGTHTGSWDGKTDEGLLAGNGNYYIKVLSNNVNYVWEGTIGNNSDALTGPTIQRGYAGINGMVVVGQYAYTCKGYSEGNPSQLKLDLNNPRTRIQILPAGEGTGQITNFVASDGNYVYWAGYDKRTTPSANYHFVFATRTSNNTDVVFPAGRSYKARIGRTYTAIDTINNANGLASGLAVQPSGNFLFVSHGILNKLHVLNKTTGAVVQTLSYTNPGALTVDSANHLWMSYISGGSRRVEKFTVDTSGVLTSTGVIISGLQDPQAMAAAPDNQIIVIADGGTSQQLKAFDLSTGAPGWTYGQAGGYATSPTVSNDKFYWNQVLGVLGTFIAFQPDGSFWVGDAGNSRAQHFAANRTFLDRIAYIPHFYNCVVDGNNPSRVFADWMEYEIDYSKPLARNNDSWKLVRNWGYVIDSAHIDSYNRFRGLATLSNGRTYALLLKKITTNTNKWEVVELPPSGNLRYTNVLLTSDNLQLTQLYPDGSLRKMTRQVLGQTTKWSKRRLTGFDGSFNPLWSTDSIFAASPPMTGSDPGYFGNPNKLRSGEITSSGVVIAFDGTNYHGALYDNYHLGGVKPGTNKWLWRTAMSTQPDYMGEFPADGGYDIGNNVEYSGVPAMALDRNIFWGYHGEFWKNSQTNKWNHVYDNGLFVNQFGVLGPDVKGQEATAGMAGNAFSANVVKINDTVYLYHNDEGHHGGIHRWRITGLATIAIQTDTVSFIRNGMGLRVSYYDDLRHNNVYHKLSRIDSVVHINHAGVGLSDTSRFSVSWTGYIEPLYTQKYRLYTNTDEGVRLWVDGRLIISKRDTTNAAEYSDSVAMIAGLRYPVRMEVFETVGASSASLSWSSSSQLKEEIPSSQLYPDSIPNYSGGYDLLENLPYHKPLENNTYGWTRNPVLNDTIDQYRQYWLVKTNIKGTNRLSPDLCIKYVIKPEGSTAYVNRDLGTVDNGITGWQLKGVLDYEKNLPNEDSLKLGTDGRGGSFLEVLDDQGKVITRFFWVSNYGSTLTHLYLNNKKVATGSDTAMLMIYSKAQPFNLTMSGDSATVQYGPFPPVTAVKFDPAAHANKPKIMRFFAFTNQFNSGRAIDFVKMKFQTSMLPGGGCFIMQHRPIVQEEISEDLLKIYPNPSSGSTGFYLNYSGKTTTDLHARVVDLSGRTVYEGKFSKQGAGIYNIRFHTKLTPGIYIVIVNQRHAEKLVVF